MPGTINGIGTHYYGRKNAYTRPGPCEHCKAAVPLNSYDTRLWIVVIFIPLIPLGRKRILDECPSCGVHRAVGLHQWEEIRREALENAMKEVVAHPQDAEKQMALHGLCIELQETDKAKALEERLENEFPQNEHVFLHLASAHAFLGRAREASRCLKRAKELNPEIQAEVEVEKEPLRSAVGTVGSRGVLIVVAVLAVLVVGGLLIANSVVKGRRTLYVVTGIPARHTVTIPGLETIHLEGPAYREITLPEGTYVAQVRGPIETDQEFTIDGSFFARLFDNRVFILNVANTAMVIKATAVYRENPVEDEGTYSVHYERPFFEFRRIDAPFRDLPEQIDMKSDRETRSRLDVIRISATDVANSLAADGRENLVYPLLEWGLLARPWERDELLGAYVQHSLGTSPERGLQFLQERLAERPVEIEWHRHYQQLKQTLSPAPEVIAQYDGFLEEAPRNADLLYLRGRLDPKVSGAADYYRRALQIEAGHAYAHHALAYGLSSIAQWAEAKKHATQAHAMAPEKQAFRALLDGCLMATKAFKELQESLQARIEAEPNLYDPRLSLVMLLAAKGERVKALEECAKYEKIVSQIDPDSAGWVNLKLRGSVFYALGDFKKLNSLLEEAKDDSALSLRVASLLEQGRVQDAEKAMEGNPGVIPPVTLLSMAMASQMSGDSARFDQYVKQAAGKYESKGPEGVAASKLLKQTTSDSWEEGLDISLGWKEKCVILAAVAARASDPPKKLVELVRALNTDYTFPFHLIHRVLDRK